MLIPSKLSRPVRLQNTVIRDRLLAKLASTANYRLTLVNCPAGYGKTTLVAQWAAGKSDLGWYSLDESDNQPCLLYTSPSPRDRTRSRMPSSA